jgi:hypothetical protein
MSLKHLAPSLVGHFRLISLHQIGGRAQSFVLCDVLTNVVNAEIPHLCKASAIRLLRPRELSYPKDFVIWHEIVLNFLSALHSISRDNA